MSRSSRVDCPKRFEVLMAADRARLTAHAIDPTGEIGTTAFACLAPATVDAEMSPVDRTSLREITQRCGRGHMNTHRMWVVIDAQFRPDLVPAVRLWTVRCQRCGRGDPRKEPLLVLCRDVEPPIGLFVPGPRGFPEAPPDWLADLGDEQVTMVVSTAEAAFVAATRDLGRDLANSEAAADELGAVHGAAVVGAYVQLLQEIAGMHAIDSRMALIEQAVTTTDAESFLALLGAHPELLDDATLTLLDDQYAADPDIRLELGRRLLHAARADPRRAWKAHFEAANALGGELVSGFEEWERRLEAAMSNPDELLAVAEGVLRFAEESAADDEFVAMALEGRAVGHLRSDAGYRSARIEAAVDDYREILSLTPVDHPGRAGRLLNAAVATAQLMSGDPGANARLARSYLEEALELTDEAAEPELVAMIRTNLAHVTLLGASDADVGELRAARRLCERALTYRSPERDVENWAYTMVNLGSAIERLAAVGEAELSEAADAYRAVATHADDLPVEVAAHARVNLLVAELRLIASAEEEEDAHVPPAQHDSLVALADMARLVTEDDAVPSVVRGRALRRLGEIRRRLGEDDEAISAWQRAVPLLVAADLRDLRETAWALAAVLSEKARWPEARDAYVAALDAADQLWAAPWRAADREAHIAASNRLPRWAAHAFVMCGELERAVIALENGRTRELRRQLEVEDPQVAELETLMPQAVVAWRDATARLATAETGDDAAGAALEQALERLRAVPSFERFGRGANLRTVQEAALPNQPVIYINPTPYGTALLRVDAGGTIVSRNLAVTSRDVVFRVFFGISPTTDQDAVDDAVSYTLAAAGRESDSDDWELPNIADALDALLPWVGRELAEPLAELLSEHEDTGALLVCCGPLGSVPLGAAPIAADDDRRLLDDFVLWTTPSATAHAVALRRAAATTRPVTSLVSVADPTEDLRFALAEVKQLSGAFDGIDVAVGRDATRGWLTSRVANATVLHMACHGYGGMMDARDSGFVLADGIVTGPEVADLPLRGARLAVASACQSGVTEITDLTDEAFSLGAALLAAGTAGAIASLWSVDDLATAMLMTRFYEQFAAGLEPGVALRDAQLWIRKVDAQGIGEFMSRHPVLAAESKRRGDWWARSSTVAGAPRAIFSHPMYWAPFVILGV